MSLITGKHEVFYTGMRLDDSGLVFNFYQLEKFITFTFFQIYSM